MSDVQLHKDKQDIIWVTTTPYIKPYQAKDELVLSFLRLVMAFNDIALGPKGLDFVAYMILRGGLVTQLGRKLYREKHSMSKGSVDNIVKQLKEKRVLITEKKEGDKKGILRVHPKIAINFKDDNYIFQFKCLKK